jgi:hypothetical protein
MWFERDCSEIRDPFVQLMREDGALSTTMKGGGIPHACFPFSRRHLIWINADLRRAAEPAEFPQFAGLAA